MQTLCPGVMNRCGASAGSQPAIPGLDQYMSADGPIFIQQSGNVVVAVESFDEDSAKKLIEAGLKQPREIAIH